MFGFFALNFSIRRRNQTQGSFFVRNSRFECPTTIDEMKQRIKNNDTKFLDKIYYYSSNIIGSNSYWNHKKEELESWINHHVEKGNGLPLFFITLSCAEYYWPDIIRLLTERMEIMNENFPKTDSKSLVSIVNKLSIVVQEYFQLRVKTFLETVGKTIFGIDHYWVRFEFAPSRGQIHAHLLGISSKCDFQQQYFDLKKIPMKKHKQILLQNGQNKNLDILLNYHMKINQMYILVL